MSPDIQTIAPYVRNMLGNQVGKISSETRGLTREYFFLDSPMQSSLSSGSTGHINCAPLCPPPPHADVMRNKVIKFSMCIFIAEHILEFLTLF